MASWKVCETEAEAEGAGGWEEEEGRERTAGPGGGGKENVWGGPDEAILTLVGGEW